MIRSSKVLVVAFVCLVASSQHGRGEDAAPHDDAAAPAPKIHVVTQGETLSAIAHRYGTTVSKLKDRNHLSSDLLQIGQKLVLPTKGKAKAKAEPKTKDIAVEPEPKQDAPADPPAAVTTAKPDQDAPPAPAAKDSSDPKKSKKLANASKKEKPSKTPPTLEERLKALSSTELFRLQVFLDRACLAPGKVDGTPGEFTQKAVLHWLAMDSNRTWDALVAEVHDKVSEPVVSFTVPDDASKFVGAVPNTLEEKAASKSLLYASLADYVAERFHTDVATLHRLNKSLKNDAAPGDTLKVPNVTPFEIESWKSTLQSKEQRISGANIRIRHLEHLLEVCRPDGSVAAMFPITVGEKPEYVRSGPWRVASVSPNPTFMWDEEMLKHGKKGEKQYLLPPGPNNPVGILWLELQPVQGPVAHIGIHGTNNSARIGRNHSSGCIRLANWDIIRLAHLVNSGTQVRWSPQPTQPIVQASVSDAQ